MFIDEKEDTEVNQLDREELLNMLSDDIVLDNILTQISNIDSKIIDNVKCIDLFSYFKDMYNFIIFKYTNNNDIITNATEVMKNIIEEIINAIEKKFHFKIVFNDESIQFNDKISYVQNIYEFFILNINDSINSLCYNYIINNIESIKKICKIKNKKDLSYINIKKIIDNDYTNLIYLTSEIINNIEIIDNADTINYMIKYDEGLEYNYFIKKFFNESYFCEVTFNENLCETLSKIIRQTNNVSLVVQNDLINKYK